MIHKYKQLADVIENDIINEVYKDNSKLLTEEEYANKFQVSRSTVRKAIQVLVNKGYVYQVQGSGIFIRNLDTNNYVNLQQISGLTNDFSGRKIETTVLDFKLQKANKELSDKMRCKEGALVYYVKRLRKINGCTFSIEYSYFNKDIVMYLDENIIKKSIYKYIKEDLKLTIGFADRVIYADFLDDGDAELLELDSKSPALITDNTVYLSNGYVFDISTTIHNYKNVKMLKTANFIK